MDRLIRRAGAERVSSSASERLAQILEGIATLLTKDAVRFARHARRTTVTSEDIDAAYYHHGLEITGKAPENF